jgi:hypothetical protein
MNEGDAFQLFSPLSFRLFRFVYPHVRKNRPEQSAKHGELCGEDRRPDYTEGCAQEQSELDPDPVRDASDKETPKRLNAHQ